MPLRSSVTWEIVDKGRKLGIDPNPCHVLLRIQSLDRPTFLQQVFAVSHTGRTDRKSEIFFDLLQCDLDRILLERRQILVNLFDYLSRRIGILDEELLQEPILVRIKHQASRRFTVTSSSARLLVIGFDAAGKIVMQHKSKIRFIDSHAECIRCDNDRCAAGHKIFLHRSPLSPVQSGVVIFDLAFDLATNQFNNVFTVFSSRRVDDAASGRRLEKLD